MQTVLLTGATGLVGSRLLPRLSEAGFDCRALVRRDVDLPPGVTGVRGELSDLDVRFHEQLWALTDIAILVAVLI